MESITLVTGNPNKLKEFQAILGELQHEALDLPEVQDPSVAVVAREKAKVAFQKLGKPVIVEDTSLELSAWKGLPGTFIKFFEKTYPQEAAIKLLAGFEDRTAAMVVAVAYADADGEIVIEKRLSGTIAHEPRGSDGWNFDFYFIPEGETRTFAEMTQEEKLARVPRRDAICALKEVLEKKYGKDN